RLWMEPVSFAIERNELAFYFHGHITRPLWLHRAQVPQIIAGCLATVRFQPLSVGKGTNESAIGEVQALRNAIRRQFGPCHFKQCLRPEFLSIMSDAFYRSQNPCASFQFSF